MQAVNTDDIACFCMLSHPSSQLIPISSAAGERSANESVEDATSQVKIKEAFATPDNLQNCTAFLRSYAADRSARASCTVVPAQQIAYPQVAPPRLIAGIDSNVSAHSAHGLRSIPVSPPHWLCILLRTS